MTGARGATEIAQALYIFSYVHMYIYTRHAAHVVKGLTVGATRCSGWTLLINV